VWSKWDLGWPWLCLGGGLALFAVLFTTNAARSTLTVSRWRDPVWLAWLTVRSGLETIKAGLLCSCELVRAVGIEPTTHGLKTPGGCVWSGF